MRCGYACVRKPDGGPMKKAVKAITILILAAAAAVLLPGAYVVSSASGSVVFEDNRSGISAEAAEELNAADAQCVLVLGCAVWENNQPSPMLRDRLDTAIELYESGAAPKLLFSGDNSRKEYSEPDCMLAYALSRGVPEDDIFLDFAGFSTYDSVYRAKAVFGADSVIVVTQKYHMYRALYTCEALGLRAVGAASDRWRYRGALFREAREVLARDEYLLKCLLRPDPKFLGEAIDLSGDGTVTHVN